MALINRETDYGIRILRALSDGIEKPVARICEEQQFTKPFAYKIIKKLEKGGFVKITRGKQGGVVLACDLSQASLYSLMEALNNVIYVNECFKPDYVCEFSHENDSHCKVHTNLFGLQKTIDKELKNCMLLDLI